MLANQVGGNAGRRFVGLLHGQCKQMVGGAFVHEAFSALVDGDHAGLGAVHDEMGKHRLRAICALAQGHGSPEGMGAFSVAILRTQLAGQHLCRAGMAGCRRAPSRSDIGQHRRAQQGVTVEATAGENDTTLDAHATALAVLHQRDRVLQ